MSMTPVKVTLDDFKIVNNDKMKLALFNFFNTIEVPKNVKSRLNRYIKHFKNIKLSDVTRLTFSDTWDNLSISSKKSFCRINICFLGFLVENHLYEGEDINDLTKFLQAFKEVSPATLCNDTLLNRDKTLRQFFVFKPKGKGIKIVDTNCQNEFIIHLLDSFYNSSGFCNEKFDTDFASTFISSYEGLQDFKNITDFNYSVFQSQFKYYEKNRTLLKLLVMFYIYLNTLLDNESIFKIEDPIDVVMLQRSDFIDKYQEGYKIVYINPFEKVPTFDKWAINPNGFEKFTTRLNHRTYLYMDFSSIHNELYRQAAKQYFWNDTKNLDSKRNTQYIITEFFNFISNYKSNFIGNTDENIDYTTITTVDVFSFRSNIETGTLSVKTKNNKYQNLKYLLQYCEKEKILNVESGCFEFLRPHSEPDATGGTDIPDDELKKLEKHLRNLSEENLRKNLYYIIFHIAIETEFRISQILSLKISEIKEGMKKGQFYIHSTNKISNKDKQEQHISEYAKRHLDIAIKHTEKLREAASEKNKDYVFLFKNPNNNHAEIKPIRAGGFSRFLKKECKRINIKEYTAANLRDTHMTKAIEYAFKNGLSDVQTKILVNHKNLEKTTGGHYVNPRIRTFAEATFGVTIGDVDIKGNILAKNNDEFSKDETVDNGCGFCKESACKIKNELGCPMCDGFVVTLDRIPFYEQRIKEIDTMIANESIAHEIEHLQTIKRLYVAYLERLYQLKEELS